MISIDATKTIYPENGQATVPLSAVSTVAFIYSADHPVKIRLVNPDGEVVPCGVLEAGFSWHKLELRNYVGLRFEEQLPKGQSASLMLQLDVRHKTGEKISSEALTAAVMQPQALSEAERTRRTVMRTLMTLNVMPSEDQMDALEAELGFDFEAEDFGDYLEPDFVEDEDPSPVPVSTGGDQDDEPPPPSGDDTVQ